MWVLKESTVGTKDRILSLEWLFYKVFAHLLPRMNFLRLATNFYFIFVFVPLLFGKLLISGWFHILSIEKPHFSRLKFGSYTAPVSKWLTNHKTNGQLWEQMFCWKMARCYYSRCLMEQARQTDWKGGPV